MDVVLHESEETSPTNLHTRKAKAVPFTQGERAAWRTLSKHEVDDRRSENSAFLLRLCLDEALDEWRRQYPRYKIEKHFDETLEDPIVGDATLLYALLQSMARRITSETSLEKIIFHVKRDHLFSSETHLAFSIGLEVQKREVQKVRKDESESHHKDEESNWNRQLIQKLGGELRWETPRSGWVRLSARVRFPKGTLPLVESESGLDGIKVLVVDDDSMSRMLTAAILRSLGAQVLTARHGAEAIECAKLQRFDMVFLDIEMPVLDGIETLPFLRQVPSYQNVPVLALTSHEQQAQHAYYLEQGMQDVMVKPVGKATILSAVERYLRGKTQSRLARPESFRSHEEDPGIEPGDGSDGTERGVKELSAAGRLQTWVDAGQLRDAFADERELLELCITVFSKRYPVLLDEIDDALRTAQLADIARASHEIKGMLANLWVPTLSALAADIEDWARDGLVEGSGERLEQLRRSIPGGIMELQGILRSWPEETKKTILI